MSYSRWWGCSWYIFWDSGGDDDCRDSQTLAIWSNLSENTPSYGYGAVKHMVDTDNWEPLGLEEIVDKEVLVLSCKQWLEDVDREYPVDEVGG